jgi:hypothetical protein
MIELVYYSISNTEITSEILSDILITSRDFNSKNNVTGCLLYHNKVFLQLLEGEKETVENLFEKIKEDKRHSNIILVVKEGVNKRLFTDWSMAFHELNSSKMSINQFIKDINFFTDITEKQTEASDMFWRMVKQIVVK